MVTVIAIVLIWAALGWFLWRCFREALSEWRRQLR